MRPTINNAAVLAMTAMLAAVAGGCGSGGTKTVSAPGQGDPATAPSTTTHAATHSSAQNSASPPSTATSGREGGSTQSTRTATAPAFTKESSSSEGLTEAVNLVKAHGYTPQDTSQYHSAQTLRVLLATRTGSGDGYDQQAFFFLGGHYLGTDTSSPSAGIALVSQSDTEATLAYHLYLPRDPLCCARGGEAKVRFQLNNGRLTALDPIPPSESSTVASRR